MREQQSLTACGRTATTQVYSVQRTSDVDVYVASSPYTRSICNDVRVCGVAYTERLRLACAEVLKAVDFGLEEGETVVVNVLRGGLNFGLREALAAAYGWNRHATSFISAQRFKDADNVWGVTEKDYNKIELPPTVSFVIGDVVATGTSMRHCLHTLAEAAKDRAAAVRRVVVFTVGGAEAERALCRLDAACRQMFPHYRGASVVYLEGRFEVPEEGTPMRGAIAGTDLVRRNALMAPEFVASHYENPAYPLERCAIYDAGSRAFFVKDYAADVRSYWEAVLALARAGVTFAELLAERFPALDAAHFGDVSLEAVARRQIEAMAKFA